MVRKKGLLKAAALGVGISLVLICFTGRAEAKPRFDFDRFIKKPVLFAASLLSFLPVYDAGRYAVEAPRVGFEYKMKSCVNMPSHRIDGGD